METGKVCHIYNRGNNKENIFFETENYFSFLRQFDKYLSPKVDVFSYCLMPNHFHFLLRIKVLEGMPEQEISKAVVKSFKDFLISYVKAINKRYDRTGSLFQPRLKRKEIDNDFYFSWIIQYIHLNPVKAGLCRRAAEWKFSSYNAIVSRKPTKICVKEVIEWFGGLSEFIRIHDERIINEARLKAFVFED